MTNDSQINMAKINGDIVEIGFDFSEVWLVNVFGQPTVR